MNEYDDVAENIHRCFGSLDHVFNAGRSERKASAEVKRALETQGLTQVSLRPIIGDYLLKALAPVRNIEATIAEAMGFFFNEADPQAVNPSVEQQNPTDKGGA